MTDQWSRVVALQLKLSAVQHSPIAQQSCLDDAPTLCVQKMPPTSGFSSIQMQETDALEIIPGTLTGQHEIGCRKIALGEAPQPAPRVRAYVPTSLFGQSKPKISTLHIRNTPQIGP